LVSACDFVDCSMCAPSSRSPRNIRHIGHSVARSTCLHRDPSPRLRRGASSLGSTPKVGISSRPLPAAPQHDIQSPTGLAARAATRASSGGRTASKMRWGTLVHKVPAGATVVEAQVIAESV
jgi:hypothetical protein